MKNTKESDESKGTWIQFRCTAEYKKELKAFAKSQRVGRTITAQLQLAIEEKMQRAGWDTKAWTQKKAEAEAVAFPAGANDRAKTQKEGPRQLKPTPHRAKSSR